MVEDGEWSPLLEDLLRGLVHAMNNRVTALSAYAELAAVDDDALEVSMLRQETLRLHQVSSLISALATRSDEREALELGGVVDLALEIHSHHPRMRSVPCALEKIGAVLPVRVPRWAMLRLALIMIDAAKRAAGETSSGTVVMWLSGSDVAVCLRFVSPKPLGRDAEVLSQRCGGTLSFANGEVVLELPSLLELRRREKAAR